MVPLIIRKHNPLGGNLKQAIHINAPGFDVPSVGVVCVWVDVGVGGGGGLLMVLLLLVVGVCVFVL
jgi:hypothetical protein